MLEIEEAYFKLWGASKFAPCLVCLRMKRKRLMTMEKDGYVCAECWQEVLENDLSSTTNER